MWYIAEDSKEAKTVNKRQALLSSSAPPSVESIVKPTVKPRKATKPKTSKKKTTEYDHEKANDKLKNNSLEIYGARAGDVIRGHCPKTLDAQATLNATSGPILPFKTVVDLVIHFEDTREMYYERLQAIPYYIKLIQDAYNVRDDHDKKSSDVVPRGNPSQVAIV